MFALSVPQKRRSSRQVKRKRYTEDLEFRISEDDDSGNDSPLPKSPSSSSQQQVHLRVLLLVWIKKKKRDVWPDSGAKEVFCISTI